ncbi:MAG: hypothetical protein JWO83_3567 [Caulobacteraceae bacterium]|nr:hypothetical protein [Caulobacteraceae bacterium]
MRKIELGVCTALAALILGGGACAQQADVPPSELPAEPPGALTPPSTEGPTPQAVFGAVAEQVINATVIAPSVNLVYDSNIARSSAQVAAQRGLKLSDEIAEPALALNLARVFGRESVTLKGIAGYDFYRSNTQLDRQHIDLAAGVNAALLRCGEGVNVEYSSQQSDLTQQSIRVVRNTRSNTVLGASLGCGGAIGLAPNASVSQIWSTNSNGFAKAGNSNSFSANAGVSYRRPSLGSISLFGSYSKTTYPGLLLIGPGLRQGYGYTLYAGGVSLFRHTGSRLEGSASLSFTSLNPETAGSNKFQGLTYSLSVIYHVNSRIYVEGLTSRQTTPSNRVGSNFSIDESYGVDASFSASSRLSFLAGGNISRNNYNVVAPTLFMDLTKQELYSAFQTANYQLTRRLHLNLSISETKRTANFPGLSYTGERVTLGVQAVF